MEPSEHSELPGAQAPLPDVEPDRLDSLEARVRMLEERVPDTQLLSRRFLPRAFAVLGHYFVAGLIIYVATLGVLLLVATVGAGIGSLFGIGSFLGLPGTEAVREGPSLSNVASLPVDASGVGTIRGTPTGEGEGGDSQGSFVLVLTSAPAGLPARTTLHVAFDHSTQVYRDGEPVGDPLEAMNDDEPVDADPSSAGNVVVRFHIKNGQVFADRLELSGESPSD